jgi:hypothetical protein
MTSNLAKPSLTVHSSALYNVNSGSGNRPARKTATTVGTFAPNPSKSTALHTIAERGRATIGSCADPMGSIRERIKIGGASGPEIQRSPLSPAKSIVVQRTNS